MDAALPASGWLVHVSVDFDILPSTHGSCSYFLICSMHLLLLVTPLVLCML